MKRAEQLLNSGPIDALRRIVAVSVLVAAVTGCRTLPWNRAAETAPETNVSFSVRQNLLHVRFHVGEREGWGIVSTRHPATILDAGFAASATSASPLVRLGSVGVVESDPRIADLQGIADAILARDLWGEDILTIDWRSALVTIHRSRRATTDGESHSWTDTPRVRLQVGGRVVEAEVDTTSPEALVLTGASAGRRRETVEIAGVKQEIDVAIDPRVPHARIGTRLLSRFLVQIDYGRRQVILWPK